MTTQIQTHGDRLATQLARGGCLEFKAPPQHWHRCAQCVLGC
jgi:hypothetical protein